MLLTPEQLYEIQKIIFEHHAAFSANTMGEQSVPPEVLARLKEKGLVTKQSLESIGESYTYGQLLGQKESQAVANMSYLEFKDYMSDNPMPLSDMERGAMRMAALSAGQYCRGLGNRVDVATGAILIEADRQLRVRMESDIRTATEKNIAKRETVEQLKSDLGWATKDWARDMKRIAVTEKVTAMNHGTADAFKKKHGPDVLVSKRALPGACKWCQKLYNGPSGPRVFKLSDLEANGTNVGKKAGDWLPVTNATHPSCQCVMVRVPEGWGFDEDGDLVPGGEIDMYESEEELELAIREEADLQKAFALQGHIVYQGIPIAIENKEGSVRKWTDVNGDTGETKMQGVSYGYVKGTTGADEDEIDVFIGPDPRASNVYVIEQQNPHNGTYDEQKCFLGFPSQAKAERVYRLHYDNPDDFIIIVQPMSVEHFKRWLAITKKKQGEMVKSKEDIKLVIPFPNRLSKGLATQYGAHGTAAGNRAPGPGLGVNYVIFPPTKSEGTGYSPEAKEMFDEYADDKVGALHVEKEVYEFTEPQRKVAPMVIPENIKEEHEAARDGAEENNAMVKRESIDNVMRPKNKAPVEKQK